MPESERLAWLKKIAKRIAGTLARPRFWVSLFIVCLWVAVMGRLWVRESGRMGGNLRQIGVSPEVLLVSWVDYDQWMWIEQNGRRIGLTQMSITPMTRPLKPGGTAKDLAAKDLPGYLMRSHTRLAFRMGIEVPVEITMRVEMNAAFELDNVQASIEAAGQRFLMQAFAEDKSLYYRVAANPGADPKAKNPQGKAPAAAGGLLGNPLLLQQDLCGQSPLSEPIFLSEALIPILTRTETLKPGQSWATRASDPLQGLFHAAIQVKVEGKEKLRIEGEGSGETVEAWRMTEKVGAMQSTVWYDLRGKILRREMGEGSMRMSLANPAKALALYPGFDRPDRFPPIDRAAIKKSVDPKLRGKPLKDLLPAMPAL